MTSALLVGLVWVVVATALALALGRAIRTADVRHEGSPPDLRREVETVLAGLEADLRAAAGATPPAA